MDVLERIKQERMVAQTKAMAAEVNGEKWWDFGYILKLELTCREPVRHSTRDKGHEEGGSAYAKAGSSLRSPPGYSRAFSPQKP